VANPPTPILLVPGYTNGGPRHWMTFWERANPEWSRLREHDFESTDVDAWVAALDRALGTLPGPAWVIAHSLGCITVVHHAARGGRRIAGALLVAPADVEHAPGLPMLRGFGPVPRTPLPFPAAVVASTDDPYLPRAGAAEFASAWGAELHDVGAAGHINSDSDLGEWAAGRAIWDDFRRRRAPG
jgi:predicted alpha/beta hydrolase family esterase